MKLKIWTDKDFIKNNHYVTMLIPFFGYEEDPNFIDKNRFLQYFKRGKEFFELVDNIKDCDVIVCPLPYEKKDGPECAKILSTKAKENNKKMFLFFNSDSSEDVEIENAIIFRTSFYKSKKKKNEYALPGWSQDYLESYYNNQLQIREKKDKPTVGYSGYIDIEGKFLKNSFIKNLKILKRIIFNEIPYHAKLRGKVVRFLLKNKKINSNFIIRDDFMGSNNKLEIRKEFVENIVSSDYCLATRGNGNFSYRLYEIMSLGRIPLFVNTDSVLPYEEFVDWKEYFCWVEERDLKNIDKIVLAFHEKISPSEFINLQKEIRRLYEEWISPVGFHKNLWRYLKYF